MISNVYNMVKSYSTDIYYVCREYEKKYGVSDIPNYYFVYNTYGRPYFYRSLRSGFYGRSISNYKSDHVGMMPERY